MIISAIVESRDGSHRVAVRTGEQRQSLAIAAKPAGRGSSVNGGEFLMLALASCYCNDLYREAARLGIAVDGVEVEASAEFAGIGLAAANITYRVKVTSSADGEAIAALVRETDAVAEVHNTIRAGVPVTLRS